MAEPTDTVAVSCRLADKRCLIVGGTSGIGLAAATRFLEEAAAVIVAGLPNDPLPDEKVAELKEIGPIGCIPCDARDPSAVASLLDEAIGQMGGLDVLFHVAGGSGRGHGDGALHDCTDAGWHATLMENLTTTFLTNRAAIRHFLGRKQPGVILNTASVLALSPSPRYFDTCAYAAAKAGVIALSRQAASSYAGFGIRINVLVPGLIDTPMAARAVTDPVIGRYLESKQPLAKGPGTPADCAEAAVFLCSDEARFITGAVLPVDGGWCVSEGQA